jgi:RNA polymerase sigma-70 factor, ECF subfamily
MRIGRRAREFDEAVRTHSSALFRYAFWLCRDRGRAEDVVQEALMRAWKAWDDLEDPGATRRGP